MQKKILVICETGISASLFVSKMVLEARQQALDYDIDYASFERVDNKLAETDYDVLVLTPQIARHRSKIEEIIQTHKCKAQIILMSNEIFSTINVIKLLAEIK